MAKPARSFRSCRLFRTTGAAARPQVPVVRISDLQGYVSTRVRELTSGSQKPMMAMPTTVEDYPISRRLQ